MDKAKNSLEMIAGFEQRIQELNVELSRVSNGTLEKPNAASFEAMQDSVQALTRELCDVIEAKRLQMAINTEEVGTASGQLSKSFPQKIKSYGSRLTPVRMSNGTQIDVLVPYYARPCNQKKTWDWIFPRIDVAGCP
jgi:hypothetical protein